VITAKRVLILSPKDAVVLIQVGFPLQIKIQLGMAFGELAAVKPRINTKLKSILALLGLGLGLRRVILAVVRWILAASF